MRSMVFVQAGMALLFCLTCSEPLFGQVRPDSLFSSSALHEDLDELKSTLLETHVNPYIYCTKESFDAAFEHAAVAIDSGATYAQFAAVVGQFLQVMRDSHTCLSYHGLHESQIQNDQFVLPFEISSTEDGVFVSRDPLKKLPAGARILSISGVSADSLLLKFRTSYSCWEGSSPVGNRRVADAVFPVLLGLEVPLRKSNQVNYISYGESDTTLVNYPGMQGRDLRILSRNTRRESGLSEFQETYSLKYDADHSVAILKVGSFSFGSSRLYKRFLNHSFRTIHEKNIENLVVDLRDNTGGQSTRMESLLAHLSDAPPSLPDNIIARQSDLARKRVKNVYRGINKFIINHFFNNNEEVMTFRTMMNMSNGDVDTLYFSEPETSPEKLIYKNRAVLLMNGISASASVNFASGFRRISRGPIVGEPCLGPVHGTWGNPAPFELSNTGLGVYISTIRFNADRSFVYEPTPIYPDYYVETTPRDLAESRDAQLTYVLITLLGDPKEPRSSGPGE